MMQNKQQRSFFVKHWRVAIFFTLVATTLFSAGKLLLEIILTNGVTPIEPIIFILFMVCFVWIAIGFWSSVIGFILLVLRKNPITLKTTKHSQTVFSITKRTALVMPIYNEDPTRVMAGLHATLESLKQTQQQYHFDCFVLSDTTDAAIAQEEHRAWQQLKVAFENCGINIFYRRRTHNHYRKVGNLTDFCQRWGSHYDYMVVLDADSIMDGTTILQLVYNMQTNPSMGLIQTVPLPVRQRTFFGRFLQFAADLHSPLLAAGYSFWQTDTGNYWGHNAIIHIDAFIKNCCLPYLPGQPPFGGEILSHDFVEAALLKRGGWQVITMIDARGSYEEVPSNIIDYIVRDRRWCQGNLQHLRLLGGKGLHYISRFHFLSGAMAYITSPLWLLMLAMGTADAIVQTLSSNSFFSEPYQLFPDWRITKPELIYTLLSSTFSLLLIPKLLSVILASIQRAQEFGGILKLWISAIIEILYAIIIAPVMMVFHTGFVFSLLTGVAVSWKPQSRDGRHIRWREAMRYTIIISTTAFIWGMLAFTYAPGYFWWLAPVLAGLLVAAPLIRYSGSYWLGRYCQQLGIFSIASETHSISVIDDVTKYSAYYQQKPHSVTEPQHISHTPVEKWRTMNVQTLGSF